MIRHDNFDRVLADWFEADARPAVPEGELERITRATRNRRPRPAWFAAVGSHWMGQSIDSDATRVARPRARLDPRLSTALIALVVVALLVAGALFVGARMLNPEPTLRHLGHLAYGLESNLFIADWNGANPVPVTDAWPSGSTQCHDNGHNDPTWSPDGRYLAYRSGWSDACHGIVFVVDPTGRPVTAFPGHGWDIAWSPDSTRIATWIDPDRTIGVYRLDGVLQARVTLPPGYGAYGEEDARWSPDGKSLLISLRPADWPLGHQTWELPLDGAVQRPLPASDPRSFWNASYSADGQTVAYADGPELVVAARDGTHRRVLQHPDTLSFPLLSPTGDHVVFAVGLAHGTELMVIDVATGSNRSLVGAGGTDTLTPMQFSPEGDRVLYTSDAGLDNGPVSAWSVEVDGSGTPVLVVNDGDPDWQWLPASP
jgi:Tol biopolymer transport system component